MTTNTLNAEQTGEKLLEQLKTRKILIATESLGPVNGVSRATQALLDYLVAEGFQTAVVAPQLASDELEPPLKPFPLIRLKGWSLVYNPELRVVYPFRLSRIYQKTFRPDLIYLASPASLGLQLWWQLRHSKIPLVANFQTDLAYYSRLMLPKLLGQIVGWLIDRITGYVFRRPSVRAILYPSSSSRNYLLSLGVPAEKLRWVGRGVDGLLFNPCKRKASLREKLAPNGEILLLCVSRLSLEKGFDFLAEAYELIQLQAKQRENFPKFRLIITGGNSNPTIEQNIRSYFEKRGLDVYFSGALVGEPLGEMFASADIFIFPSLTETFGQVIQEAMASGLPIVARRKGGPADLVLPDETGYLAEPEDVAAFAKYTLKLIEDYKLRASFGQTARKLAETRSWPEINRQIALILAEAT